MGRFFNGRNNADIVSSEMVSQSVTGFLSHGNDRSSQCAVVMICGVRRFSMLLVEPFVNFGTEE
jgi:hypothetical protein